MEEDKVSILTKRLDESFGNRIISLIFFGSQRYKRSKIGSDYDLYLIFDNYKPKDIDTIRSIVKEIKIDLDLTIQYLDQMSFDPNDFQDGSMGCFALDYLSLGECLLGKNIFIDYKKGVKELEYKKSLLRKINEYAYRYRRELTSLGLDEEYLLKFTKKYISRIIIDIFLYWNIHPLSKLRFMNVDEILELAKEDNWFLDVDMKLPDEKAEFEEVIKEWHLLFERIYNKFINQVQKNFSKAIS
jgi:hypothetical protein